MSTDNISRSQRRILKDIKDIYSNPAELLDSNIHIWYNDNNIYIIYVLIIGTSNTPYDCGFYFLKFTFTDEYPLKPPTAKFYTTDGTIRFNPNLYACGKVCLSLLGTWSGPQWTPTNSLTSILVSIQAMVLHTNPLKNEPGYADASSETLEQYNAIIRHENFRFAVNKMLLKPPKEFECFSDIIETHFITNFVKYISLIKELIINEDNKTFSSTYSMKLTTNYHKIYNDMLAIFKDICEQYGVCKYDFLNLSDKDLECIINIVLTTKKISNMNIAQLRHIYGLQSKFDLIPKKSNNNETSFLKKKLTSLITSETFNYESLDNIDDIDEEVEVVE